ncbi:MAG: tetratricopeptide repeat protein, partial [Gammaproteobacteria bacterium]|nr:tetratricopeptide repeat protein [Gammaproteobacteria bacterium]
MNPKEHLEKAIEINPDFSDARFQLALLYIADG